MTKKIPVRLVSREGLIKDIWLPEYRPDYYEPVIKPVSIFTELPNIATISKRRYCFSGISPEGYYYYEEQ